MANLTTLTPTQGEVLMLLVFRDPRKAQELAKGIGVSNYTYLSKLYKLETLKPKYISNACKLFDVDPQIFEKPEQFEEIRQMVEDHARRIELLELENQSLKTQIALCNARLDECERKKRILEANKN